ncbi:hypothetical protein D1816_15330 [Aquimarina sp. AD10]|uniref:Lipoprotein n=1 Tax=Aquimarina aggregata TaxID=1642818 RepID=A0A162WE44_9FLAO|nr:MULTISPECIES: hypothetical protein [Aquimarina]AXT61667.1 hypothetical protein D1816_15330 [Aquimarina sp. AD10]KZS38037.1 hypothetical protein AWE51_18500 [Aquimarina aggregata]RKN00984.1 hypothetical protein D7033_06435 [Aquimarina sp. AD10]
MKRIIVLLPIVFIISCARTLEPTAENVNKIFASKDFTFEFNTATGNCKSLSFRNDYLVYKSDKPTFRREVTYDEVLLINQFIQKIVNLHSTSLDPKTSSYYVIKNTAYTTTIVPDQEDYYFEALLKTLKLDQIH